LHKIKGCSEEGEEDKKAWYGREPGYCGEGKGIHGLFTGKSGRWRKG
jgi:hypothetical protein